MNRKDYTTLCNCQDTLLTIGSTIDGTDLPFEEKVDLTQHIKFAADKINLSLIRGRQEAEAEAELPKSQKISIFSFFNKK